MEIWRWLHKTLLLAESSDRVSASCRAHWSEASSITYQSPGAPPTHSLSETCRVNSWAFTLQVIRKSLRSKKTKQKERKWKIENMETSAFWVFVLNYTYWSSDWLRTDSFLLFRTENKQPLISTPQWRSCQNVFSHSRNSHYLRPRLKSAHENVFSSGGDYLCKIPLQKSKSLYCGSLPWMCVRQNFLCGERKI